MLLRGRYRFSWYICSLYLQCCINEYLIRHLTSPQEWIESMSDYMRSNSSLKKFSENEKPRIVVWEMMHNRGATCVRYRENWRKLSACMTRENFRANCLYLNNRISPPWGSVGTCDAYRDRLFSFRCTMSLLFPIFAPYFAVLYRVQQRALRDGVYTLNENVEKKRY